jgi:NADH-quinone oxidoreductase subunit G
MTDVARPAATVVPITIDGRAHEARPGQLVIAACADAGAHVPHFCWHPRMSPVGMCRQCIVEVDTPRGPAMVVSCMTPVAEGQVVRTDTPQVKRAQEGVLELLLANHPLDCPVCDKGGECPLQDQAFSHGPGESRFVEEKRHYEKPIPISDLVLLDRERCILCDRCTRFADEVAGDPLISFTSRGNATQVMTFPDEPFASYFSGNTVQICPVGALTATPYRFKARPWDLEQVESTCTTCAVGCRVVVQSSRNELVRLQGVDVDAVNWGWLCDRGRFSFEAVNAPDRLAAPAVRTGGVTRPASWSEAIATTAAAIRATDPSRVAILGGARGTNEDAFAWAALADALGVTRRDPRMGDGLPPEVLALPQATIDDVCRARTIVLLGPDLKEELPVLHLRVRHAAQTRRSRLVECTPRATGLTPYAWRAVTHEPGMQARAVAALLAEPEVAAQLAAGEVAVVVGRGNLAEDERWTMEAVGAVLAAAPGARVLPTMRRGNVRGALTAGLSPAASSDATPAILEAAADGAIDVLVLLGADPVADSPDADLARRAIARVPHVASVDAFLHDSNAGAHVLLPAAIHGEKSGTTTNVEGRVSDVAQKIVPRGTARADWMVAAALAAALGHDLGFGTLAGVRAAMASRVPAFAPAADPRATRGEGVLTVRPAPLPAPRAGAAARDRNGYNYRLVVSRTLWDGAIATRRSPSLATLARPAEIVLHPTDLARVGVAEGATVRVGVGDVTIALPVRADAGVARGSAWVPALRGAGLEPLLAGARDVVDVRIEAAT